MLGAHWTPVAAPALTGGDQVWPPSFDRIRNTSPSSLPGPWIGYANRSRFTLRGSTAREPSSNTAASPRTVRPVALPVHVPRVPALGSPSRNGTGSPKVLPPSVERDRNTSNVELCASPNREYVMYTRSFGAGLTSTWSKAPIWEIGCTGFQVAPPSVDRVNIARLVPLPSDSVNPRYRSPVDGSTLSDAPCASAGEGAIPGKVFTGSFHTPGEGELDTRMGWVRPDAVLTNASAARKVRSPNGSKATDGCPR